MKLHHTNIVVFSHNSSCAFGFPCRLPICLPQAVGLLLWFDSFLCIWQQPGRTCNVKCEPLMYASMETELITGPSSKTCLTSKVDPKLAEEHGQSN